MAFGGYVYQGYQDRNDELDNQRMKTAKAFEEFKKANPYATTQELRDAVDQFAGSSPYLRSGAATEETIKDIARRNSEANYARERREYQANVAAKKQNKQDMQDNLFGYYTETGDIKTAMNRLQSDLNALNPDTGFQSDQLDDDKRYLQGLDLNAISKQFDQRYFNDNKDLITSQISAGTSFDEFASNSANPHMVNSGTFKNLYSNLFEDEKETRRVAAFDKLNTLLADPNYLNQVGAGNVDSIRKAIGERFSMFLKDEEIEQRLTAQQDNIFDGKRSAAMTAGTDRAIPMVKANTDELVSYLSQFDEIDDKTAQIALQQFSMTHNSNNRAAISALVSEIDAEGDGISSQKMNEILSKYSQNGFVPTNTYKQNIVNEYMQNQGLQKKTYITDYVGDAFGDGANSQGRVGKQISENQDQIKKVLGDTADVTNFKGNQYQTRLGSSNYNSHIRDLQGHIQDIATQRQTIIDIVARSENPANFYGTINEDYGQQVTLARAQGQKHIASLDQQVEQLQQKLAQVQVEARSVALRDKGLATINDFDPGSANLLQLQDYFEKKGYADIIRGGGQLTQQQVEDTMREAGVNKHPTAASLSTPGGNPGSSKRLAQRRGTSQNPVNANYPNMRRQGTTLDDQTDLIMKALLSNL